jgi:hypothetical protein
VKGLCVRQGANHSNSQSIARICNAVCRANTRLYGFINCEALHWCIGASYGMVIQTEKAALPYATFKCRPWSRVQSQEVFVVQVIIFLSRFVNEKRSANYLKRSVAYVVFALNLIEWHVIEWLELSIFFIDSSLFNSLKGVKPWQTKLSKAVTRRAYCSSVSNYVSNAQMNALISKAQAWPGVSSFASCARIHAPCA